MSKKPFIREYHLDTEENKKTIDSYSFKLFGTYHEFDIVVVRIRTHKDGWIAPDDTEIPPSEWSKITVNGKRLDKIIWEKCEMIKQNPN